MPPAVGERRTDKAALALSGRSATRPSRTRRDDREYRPYVREEQRWPRGCIARRMQTDFHHGLLVLQVPPKETRQHISVDKLERRVRHAVVTARQYRGLVR